MSNYKKGDKFVIELDEQVGNLWKIKGFHALTFNDFGLDKLKQVVDCVAADERKKGQQEAWELARKLFDMERNNEIVEAFNGEHSATHCVIGWRTYAVAAAKVAEWEKRNEIHAGDVVTSKNSKHAGVVTRVGDTFLYGILADFTPFNWIREDCTKTGRHIDIESVFAQIK